MDRPIRYLSAADVAAAMPSLPEQLLLAERTLRALDGHADLPPKIGVHPRPEASFGHAMPALLRGDGPDTATDLLGIKWVTGFPTNRDTGRPAIGATLLLNDATTGELRAILDAGAITARRTAAVSGVALRHWAPEGLGKPLSVAIIGAGVQGHSHLAMLAVVLPGCRVVIHDLDDQRAQDLLAAARRLGVFQEMVTRTSAAAAARDADVVITLVSFGPQRQQLPVDSLERAQLVVAVDYDMCVPAAVVRGASLFLVDELGQFRANRTGAVFADYPDPAAIMGTRLDDPRPDGLVVVTHLGVGLADVVFGDAILRSAEAQGIGTLLPR
jgi:ornithine cyclodeaminase/alanine dehydrogenase-like protein (mu-crystallin family)